MGLLDLFSKDKRDERARGKNIERAVNKHAQSHRPDEGAGGAGQRRVGRGPLWPAASLRHATTTRPSRTSRRRTGSSRPWSDKGKAALPAVQRYLLVRRLDLLAAAPARQDRRPGRGDRRPRGGARPPRAGLRARPHQEDPAAQPPRRASKHDRGRRAGRALPEGHGRGGALRRGRGAAAPQARGRRRASRCWSCSSRTPRRACASACGSARASPTLGWLVHGHRGGVEKKLPDDLPARSRRPHQEAAAGLRRTPAPPPLATGQERQCQDATTSRACCSSARARSSSARPASSTIPAPRGSRRCKEEGFRVVLVNSQPGHHHDRPRAGRPHLRRAAHRRHRREDHRPRAPRRAAAHPGRADRAQPDGRAGQGGRAGEVRRQADRRPAGRPSRRPRTASCSSRRCRRSACRCRCRATPARWRTRTGSRRRSPPPAGRASR